MVQEALTNVHKHAGEGARATVRIVDADTALTVTVLDDGAGRAGIPRQKGGDRPPVEPGGPGEPEDSGGGHGLIGMRERVFALRGTVVTGPRAAGGFQVRVTLPLQAVRTGESV